MARFKFLEPGPPIARKLQSINGPRIVDIFSFLIRPANGR